MKENILPEEKLLRLIRGEKRLESYGEKETLKSVETKKAILPAKLIIKIKLETRQIKYILYFLVLFSSFYFIVSFFWPIFFYPSIKIAPSKTTSYDALKNISSEVEIKPLPWEYYKEKITKSIFGSSHVLLDVSRSPQRVNLAGSELIKDLVLLGIVSEEPRQAIIEDKKTNKVYFLKEGEFLGELQVISIREGKVTLDYQGREIDLFL